MSDQLPRSRPRWLWPVVGCTGLLAVLTLGTLVSGWFVLRQFSNNLDFLGTTLVDQLAPDKIELAAAIKLPPSTRELHSKYESFQDYNINVRFEMDAAELPMFLTQSNLTQPLTTTKPSNMPDDIGQSWWQPAMATSFLATDGPVTIPNGPNYLSVLIDTSDPTTYVVYVVAFST